MKTIIVDMMGGDNAPLETVKGVALAMEELGDDIHYILVGDELLIEAVAQENDISLEGCEIVHTEEVITMNDDPIAVVRGKENSSMSIGLRMLKDGEGDAFVSTGNTGALFTGATLIVRKIKGVKRPAIASLLPFQPPVLLADSGANVVVTPEYLEQFAVMGSAYMKNVMGVENPRVGLLNNGAEAHKGTPIYKEAYALLSKEEGIRFVGNVEGKELAFDACDVLVCDGFAGNIVLKTIEGTSKFVLKQFSGIFNGVIGKLAGAMVLKKAKGLKKRFDAKEYGGAPFLGIAKPVIKAHGNSDAKAVKNAVRQAIAYVKTGVIEEIEALAPKTEA